MGALSFFVNYTTIMSDHIAIITLMGRLESSRSKIGPNSPIIFSLCQTSRDLDAVNKRPFDRISNEYSPSICMQATPC